MNKIITLIGVKLAKKNRTFLFLGANPECEKCDPALKSVCLDNLEQGLIYEIIEVRNIHHPCVVHENGVQVVEVQRVPIQAALDAKQIYEGATISYRFTDCDDLSCPNYKYCKPLGIIREGKYKITQILGNLPVLCRRGKSLKLVKLKEKT